MIRKIFSRSKGAVHVRDTCRGMSCVLMVQAYLRLTGTSNTSCSEELRCRRSVEPAMMVFLVKLFLLLISFAQV